MLCFLLLSSVWMGVDGVEGESGSQEYASTRAVSVSNVSIPSYSGGKQSSWMTYDCGAGVTLSDTSTESKMCIISGTNKTEFNDYVLKLQEQGYTKTFARKITGNTKENIFGKFLAKDGSHSVYIALFPYLSQVRIIVDNHKDTLGHYNYTGTGSYRTELYLYSLSQPHDGWGTGSDEAMITQYRSGAGSMLFMRMSDNSLYVIDGGSANQMGDRACEELYAFLRSVTGVPDGRRMTINTWHISHPHSDHVTGFTRFIRKYHKEFDLQTVLYNFDIESTSRSYLQTVAKLYPDLKYYKPHTGDQYTVAGITFDVLYTTEDRYQPNSSNKLILNDASCIAYTHENNTSMVVQVNMDGKKVLLTGDLQKADATLMAMYPASVLQSHVLQIPHHGIDNHTELAKTVAAEVGFTNQSKKAVMSKERYYTNNSGWYPYIGQIYYAGTETVGYAADSGVFYRKAFEGYDYLKWSDHVYDLQKDNPQNGENPVKDPEQYYRYTKATQIKTSNWPYIIVDDKLDRVLSYDAVGNGGVKDALPAFYDGTNFYFSDSQRRLVNWLIKYTTAGIKSDRAVNSAVTTYYDKVMIKKWTDDYWGTPTKNHAIILGKDDTFRAEGMFGTWASCSQQFDTTSNSTWIDKLSDDTFVIYRNNNGTYYPLYRDGNIATERGWGISKLTQSKINSMRKYVRTRLYAYETTASAMNLSWTGHGDYYVQTGISEIDLATLLISDIRVKYSFEAFAGGGEIYYTSQNKKDAGTYWFEYSPAYDPSVPQDYTATIRYRSANGSVINVGNFTVHTQSRPLEETQSLFFDFTDTYADRDRYYKGSQYGRTNFDGTSRWQFARNGTIPGTVSTADGIVKLTVSDWDGSTLKSTTLSPYVAGNTPLRYDPKYAEVMQIRFKMNNMKAATDANPFIRLWYNKTVDGQEVTAYDRAYNLGKNYVSDGQYITATLYLYTQEDIAANGSVSGFPATTMAQSGTISDITVGFHNFVANTEGTPGEIVIDYIYIGPKKQMPEGIYTATFCSEDGTVLQNQTVYAGETAIYTQATPTKAPDGEMHYSFAGWKTEDGKEAVLTNISSDLTVYASYIGIAHSYSYEGMPGGILKATCSCGYEEFRDPTEDGNLRLKHSLNLASDISLNFVIPATLLEGFDMDTVYVLAEVDTYEGNTKTGVKTMQILPVEQGNYYYFTLNGLTAVNMNDRIRSVLYGTKDGQIYYSATDDYSIADYAYSQMDKSVPNSLKSLCADLLRYGSKAQIFKAYRTDNLADAAMTETDKTYLSDIEAVAFGNTNTVLNDLNNAPTTWVGKALDLESKVALKYIFSLTDYTGDIKDLTLRVSYKDVKGNEKTLTLVSPEVYNEKKGYYAFTFDGLLAAELRTVVSAQIFAGENPASCTLQYSADAYGNNKTGVLGDLCKALFAYCDSAKAYFTH